MKQTPKSPKRWLIALLFVSSAFLSGCSSLNRANTDQIAADQDINDPLESLNRGIYRFNTAADRWVLRPMAKGYADHVPYDIRHSFDNALSNLGEPTSAVNALLQGKGGKAASATGRFFINSTVGLAGFFDVASHFNLPKHREDFGQTLASWGTGDGPFIMLPILGPSSLRDATGRIVDSFTTAPTREMSSNQAWGYRVVDGINARSKLLSVDDLLALQADPYAFMRDTYRNSRQQAINDGAASEEEDALEDELFEDE